jgi:hypothetical protein
MGCLWVGGGPINPHVLISIDTSSINSITRMTSTTTCLLTKRGERPQQRRHKGEVLATMSARKKYYYVVDVGVGVGVVELAIMQHPSNCDGIAIFRISTNNCAIWPNSYQHPMKCDLFPTSSKFRHSCYVASSGSF